MVHLYDLPADVLRLIILSIPPPVPPPKRQVDKWRSLTAVYQESSLAPSAKGFLSLSRTSRFFRRLTSEPYIQKKIRSQLLMTIHVVDYNNYAIHSILPSGVREGWQTETRTSGQRRRVWYENNGTNDCPDDLLSQFEANPYETFSEHTYIDDEVEERCLWIKGKARGIQEAFNSNGTLGLWILKDLKLCYAYYPTATVCSRNYQCENEESVSWSHGGKLRSLHETHGGYEYTTYWDYNGVMTSRSSIKRGDEGDGVDKDGVEERYANNGALIYYGWWRNGEKDGLFERWYPSGNRRSQVWWKNGVKIKKKIWYHYDE